MAKIKDFKFTFQGEDRAVAINCTSSGVFTTYIPREIADAFGIKEKLESGNLVDLEKEFTSALIRYRNAQTKQELYIQIKYKANGAFVENADGNSLFGSSSEYWMSTFGSGNIDGLGFDFDIRIKETVDSKETWYETRKGFSRDSIFHDKNEDPEKYYKTHPIHPSKDFKVIPYSEESYNTLLRIRERIRAASEVLFNFVNQEPEKILQSLSNVQKALM